jgi:N-acetylmuramoyl-L-alanine amidase
MMLAEQGIRNRIAEPQQGRKVWWRPWRTARVDALRMSVIEWRAESIRDPLERLRFLRNTVDAGAIAPSAGGRTRRQGRKMVHAGMAAAAIIVIVAFMASPTASTSLGAYPRHFLMPPPTPQPAGEAAQKVWQVDVTPGYETYSNGLRIEKGYETSANPRVPYPVYRRRDPQLASAEMRSGPAGIVYHTTESHMAPFEPEQTGQMRRIEASVLDLVRRNHSYNYVIDRFGRVFRIVAEGDIANHAGLSIWADDKYAYVNLNGSFLGVSFETQTQRGDDNPEISPAQIHSARILTDMLRYKYTIPAGNCVTHAQVSVNPGNMRIGYHTDWAGNFPFAEIGLGDNYREPLASVFAFGFDYDGIFVQSTGRRLWQGLRASDEQVKLQASVLGMPVPAYKRILRQRYEKILAATRAATQKGENNEE